MSGPTESDPTKEEMSADDQEKRSSGTMLFTMLLLIAVFLFSSASLLSQVLQARSANGEPLIDLTTLLDQYKSLRAEAVEKQAHVDKPEIERTSPIEDIKNMVMNQTAGEAVKWPRIRITGAGKKSAEGTEDFAIINGDRVHPGEFAGKVQLVEVRAYDVVVVEYKGERRVLTVGLED